jgi:hypothetical protein
VLYAVNLITATLYGTWQIQCAVFKMGNVATEDIGKTFAKAKN